MLSTEIINNQEYIYLQGYVLVNNEWKKLEEMKDQKQPRTIKQLIKDFEKSAGNFEKFNKTMDMREQALFRGWIQQLRKEIPAFACHEQYSN
jgi:hypothetical protein